MLRAAISGPGHSVPHSFRLALSLVLAMAQASLAVGCSGCEEQPSPPSHHRADRHPEVRAKRPPSEVFAPQSGAARGGRARYRVLPAFAVDASYATDGRVEARRLIYRVSLMVPGSFGPHRRRTPKASTELVIDVSPDRLRARFQGAGWPVPDGSEVRLRRDQLGVYVFDRRGGRPLGPGQMASWFEGGRVRRYPGVRVQPPPPDQQVGPGDLLCRLLAEWANQPIDALERRCGSGGSVAIFRVGPWRADRTADVAVHLPRVALRADQLDPPEPPPDDEATAGPADLLEQLRPVYRPPETRSNTSPSALTIDDRGEGRALVVINGVPVEWVDAGRTATLAPLTAGVYRIGAMRPLGGFVMAAKPVRVPGTLTFSR